MLSDWYVSELQDRRNLLTMTFSSSSIQGEYFQFSSATFKVKQRKVIVVIGMQILECDKSSIETFI